MLSKTLRGKAGEDLACQYLERQGLILVERNYRCRRGELDLIMRDGEQLVFVEVRCHRAGAYGTPAETITRAKQAHLITAARHYLQKRRFDTACRFDVLAITRGSGQPVVEWIKDAFQTV